MLSSFVLTAWVYMREFAEIVVLGFAVAGVLQAVINPAIVVRFLSGNLVVANLLGSLIGVVTPLCCCTAIPTALTLYRAGSRRGPACAFLIATPWFNWYGLSALVIFLGPKVTLEVAGSAVLAAFGTGMLIDVCGPRQKPTRTIMRAESECCTSPSCAPHSGQPLFDLSDPRSKVLAGLRNGWQQLRQVGPWMLAGILLGAAVETFVPEHFITDHLGGASLTGLVAALLVAGLYSADSLGMLPWVQSLLSKGLGSGSAMVLLVAGVGTNISTLGPVAQAMGRRTAVLYAAGVVALTSVCGLLLNATI